MASPSSRRFPRPSPVRASALTPAERLARKARRISDRRLDYPEFAGTLETLADTFLERIGIEDRARKRRARLPRDVMRATLIMLVFGVAVLADGCARTVLP